MQALTQQLDLLQSQAAALCTGAEVEASASVGACPRVLVSVTDLLALADFSFYAHPLISQPCAALPALEAAVAEEWRSRGALVRLSFEAPATGAERRRLPGSS